MNQVIIYKQDNGIVAVIHPTTEAVDLYGIDLIAQKDVPEGRPYKIVDASVSSASSTVQASRIERSDGISDASTIL